AEYRAPVVGHVFVARRYENLSNGGHKRVKKTFDCLEEARLWQRKLDESASSNDVSGFTTPGAVPSPKNHGPTFGEVYEAFWKKKVSKLSSGTQLNYRRYIALYFDTVMYVPILDITPSFIDNLLDVWRTSVGQTHQSKSRVCFKHELSVLRSVLR